MAKDLCPCGSGKEYGECCEPIIKGTALAQSPEALMRSRYTAYAKHEIPDESDNPREPSEYSDMVEYAAEMGRIKVLNLNVTELSNTEVRNKIKNGDSIDGLVPPAVADYIKERQLYV